MTNSLEAYLCKPEECEVRWMGDTSTHFLATGALTGDAFALVEEVAKRGVSVPLHRHDDDIESFYVLDGEISFYFDDQPSLRAGAGTFVHVPGGRVHGFRIDSETARYLILTTPHHGEFYRAITSPTPHATIGEDVIGKACEDYGIAYVGPLPN